MLQTLFNLFFDDVKPQDSSFLALQLKDQIGSIDDGSIAGMESPLIWEAGE